MGLLFEVEPDLKEKFNYYLFEKYRSKNSQALINRIFYHIKPVIPRFLQIYLRQQYARNIQSKVIFPKWPVEKILIDLIRGHFSEDSFWEQIQIWPKNYRFAFCITHDVETQIGFDRIYRFIELEKKYGFRSSWNLVPEKRYQIDFAYVKEIKKDGFEIGVHGLNHDGKLFQSYEIFMSRVPKINEYIQNWGAKGFRSPATHRNWQWMQQLNILYDSSYPDTDIYEPQPGGCCSIWPFMMGKFVELPYTLPMDHTLFVILKQKNIHIWKQKVSFLKKFQGLALINIHPDYMYKPPYFEHYEKFLDFMSGQKDMWHSLPKQIASYTREKIQLH